MVKSRRRIGRSKISSGASSLKIRRKKSNRTKKLNKRARKPKRTKKRNLKKQKVYSGRERPLYHKLNRPERLLVHMEGGAEAAVPEVVKEVMWHGDYPGIRQLDEMPEPVVLDPPDFLAAVRVEQARAELARAEADEEFDPGALSPEPEQVRAEAEPEQVRAEAEAEQVRAEARARAEAEAEQVRAEIADLERQLEQLGARETERERAARDRDEADARARLAGARLAGAEQGSVAAEAEARVRQEMELADLGEEVRSAARVAREEERRRGRAARAQVARRAAAELDGVEGRRRRLALAAVDDKVRKYYEGLE